MNCRQPSEIEAGVCEQPSTSVPYALTPLPHLRVQALWLLSLSAAEGVVL